MAFCLDLHARYHCRDTGVCCRNWPVPAEPVVVATVDRKRLRRRDVTGPLFVDGGGGSVAVARDDRGDCVFFERHAERHCMIHGKAGPDALPSACRHFPRKVLRDGRGIFISLSHFCPTAARMLLAADGLTIVEAAPPLDLPWPMEGLDASDALPPLVRPGLLCDLEGFDAWERQAIATLRRDDLGVDDCLASIAAATDDVRDWTPGAVSLASHVMRAFRVAQAAPDVESGAQQRVLDAIAWLSASRGHGAFALMPDFADRWVHDVRPYEGTFDRPFKNYLAARLFGAWIAYQGRGLRSIVEWVRACGVVVRHMLVERVRLAGVPPRLDDFLESVRAADLLMLHTLDSQEFALGVAGREGA